MASAIGLPIDSFYPSPKRRNRTYFASARIIGHTGGRSRTTKDLPLTFNLVQKKGLVTNPLFRAPKWSWSMLLSKDSIYR